MIKNTLPENGTFTKYFCEGCLDYVPSGVFTRYFDDPEHRRMFCTHCRAFGATIGKCYEHIQKLDAIKNMLSDPQSLCDTCEAMKCYGALYPICEPTVEKLKMILDFKGTR